MRRRLPSPRAGPSKTRRLCPTTATEGIRQMAAALQEVIRRLKRRLDWALTQIDRLNAIRARQGFARARRRCSLPPLRSPCEET